MIVELSEKEYLYLKSHINTYFITEKLSCLNRIYVMNVSEDDASEIREAIVGDLPGYFVHNSEPTPMVMIIESLIDKLDSEFLRSVCYKSGKDNLRWEHHERAVLDLYRWMQKISKDSRPVYMEPKTVCEAIFNRRRIDKARTSQKQTLQGIVKKYMDANCVFDNGAVANFVFEDKSQILEWGDSHKLIDPIIPTLIFHEEFQILDNNFYLLIVEGGSTLHCMSLYVFKESGSIWTLQTKTHLSSTEMLVKIRIDNNLKKVLFETAFGQIGNLPFDMLLYQ